MTHGGARPNAGRPSVPIDEKRMMHLIGQGRSHESIASAFGVGKHVITARVAKLRSMYEFVPIQSNARPD